MKPLWFGAGCGGVVVEDDEELELEDPEESEVEPLARLVPDGLPPEEVAALAMSAAPTATPAARPAPIPAFTRPRPTRRFTVDLCVPGGGTSDGGGGGEK